MQMREEVKVLRQRQQRALTEQLSALDQVYHCVSWLTKCLSLGKVTTVPGTRRKYVSETEQNTPKESKTDIPQGLVPNHPQQPQVEADSPLRGSCG
jgi:hypothetical protein